MAATVPVNLNHAGAVAFFSFDGSGTALDPFTLPTVSATVSATTQVGVNKRPSITVTASLYATGKAVGGLLSLASVAGSSGRSVKIESITLIEETAQNPELFILLFNAAPSGGTYSDQSTFAWGSGDTAKLIGVVHVLTGDWDTIASKGVITIGGVDQLGESAATSITALIVTGSAYTPGSTSALKADFGFSQF